jgi:dihydroorotate dehydrogenase electron transfer subunit
LTEKKRYVNDSVIVIANDKVAEDHYVLTLGEPMMAAEVQPGQFFQVRLKGEGAPFLPRPFSLYDWHVDDSGRKIAIKLLFKVVGKGTGALSRLSPGDSVAVTGPLGNSFSCPEPGKTIIIAAGGIGIAAFLSFARQCIEGGFPARDIHLLYGARCDSLLVEYQRFKALGTQVSVITDDGSCGVKGTVLDLIQKHIAGHRREDFRIYACGPAAMERAIARYCQETGTVGELSLEARMICGVGVCNSCAVEVKSDKAPDGWDYKLVCRDGPVFSAASLHLT